MQIQLKINTTNTVNIDNFVYNYLPQYMLNMLDSSVNHRLLKQFDELFNINSYYILRLALKQLLITKVNKDTITIKLDKRIRYNTGYMINYVNLITYGNTQIKGYPILLKIFKFVSENIEDIFNMWLPRG